MSKNDGFPNPLLRAQAEQLGLVTRERRAGRPFVRVTVWYLFQSPKAVCVQKGQDPRKVWLPKSQILNVAECEKLGEGEEWVVNLKTWMAEKLGWR